MLCLACYNNRLAAVLDTATELRLFSIDDLNDICPAGLLSLPSKDPKDRTSAILACGATHLVCGAVDPASLERLRDAGITVWPWLRGPVDEVLRAYASNGLSALAMPGCKGGERLAAVSSKGRGGSIGSSRRPLASPLFLPDLADT